MCGYGPSWTPGEPITTGDAPVPHAAELTSALYFGPNSYCVGKKHAPTDPDDVTHDGRGYVCASARNKPYCTTVEELATEYCACCYCYNSCGLKNTPSFGCQSTYACGYGPDYGKTVAAAPVPDPVETPAPYRNEYCIGKVAAVYDDLGHDGAGYICRKAVNKPGCNTVAELGSLYCACCQCYTQCGMKNTVHANCKPMCDNVPSSSPPPSPPPWWTPAAPTPQPVAAGLGPSDARNLWCSGAQGTGAADMSQEGHGYLCRAALGQPGCETPTELASLYCACCYCYSECSMQNTRTASCSAAGFCDSPPLQMLTP